MCKYIRQKDSYGCAVACIAMVTGNDYDYVKQFYSAKDFSKRGIDFFDYNEFFVKHNIAINWMWPNYQADGLNVPRSEWPPNLWADMNIFVVTQYSDISHAIVVLRDGTILDPMDKNINSLDSYKRVSQIIGIYRHA